MISAFWGIHLTGVVSSSPRAVRWRALQARRGRPSCRCGNSRSRQRDRPRYPCPPRRRAVSGARPGGARLSQVYDLLSAQGCTGRALRVLSRSRPERGSSCRRETAECPVKYIPGQPLVQELALQEERDDPLAEAAAHLRQIDRWDMDESALSVKTSLAAWMLLPMDWVK